MSGDPALDNQRLQDLIEPADDLLEQDQLLEALKAYTDAEPLAHRAGDKAALAHIYGHKAVTFRRMGNIRRAIEFNQQAIELCRQLGDDLELSRWNSNLGQIFLVRGEVEPAEACFKEGKAAAARSKDPQQISIAYANYATLLSEQGRYGEAVDLINEALAAHPDDELLKEAWRERKTAIYVGWGERLGREGLAAEALQAFREAVGLLKAEEPEEAEQAAGLYLEIAELCEQLRDQPGCDAAIEQARQIYLRLGDMEKVRVIEEVSQEYDLKGAHLLQEDEVLPGVEQLEEQVRQAGAAGDVEQEGTARMRLGILLMAKNDPRTAQVFEETLAFVRQHQDRRRELILCLNFAPFVLKDGEGRRALQLAQRAVELAQGGELTYQIIAALNLGQVWAEGFQEDQKALEVYHQALGDLKALLAKDPDGGEALIERSQLALAQAAQIALDQKQTELALEFMELVDPQGAAQLRRQGSATRPKPRKVTLNDLLDLDLPELDPILAAWRASSTIEAGTALAKDARLGRMAAFARDVKWEEAQARLERAPEVAQPAGASRAGPAGLMRLAELLARDEIKTKEAQKLAEKLAVADDDLVCLCIYAIADPRLARDGTAYQLLELAAGLARQPRNVGWFFNLLGIFAHASGDFEAALNFYLSGGRALEGSPELALQAHLENEASAILQGLGRHKQAYSQARRARDLARQAGDEQLLAMATGNMGVALMNQGDFTAAARVLEELAETQQKNGDLGGLQITQQNLAVCYAQLGQFERVGAAKETQDPELTFTQAGVQAIQGNYQAAIELYERGLKLLEEQGVPSPFEAEACFNYGRALSAVGHQVEAVTQMKRAAELFEGLASWEGLHGVCRWLAVLLDEPAAAAIYAERAVQLGRQLGDPQELGMDLFHLGRVQVEAGRYPEAVQVFREAVSLSADPAIQTGLAEALVKAGQASQAIPIYQNGLEGARQAGDLRVEVILEFGLAEAMQDTGQEAAALELMQQAYRQADSLEAGDVVRVQAAERLGLGLLYAHRLEEAGQKFEAGISLARENGLKENELSLLMNLGMLLGELRDLQGAEQTLRRVREESRALGWLPTEARAVYALGNLAANWGRLEEALADYLEAADLGRQANDRSLEAGGLDSAGTCHARLGRPQRAIEYHRRAVKIHQELEQGEELLTDLLNLAQAYLALGETDNAAAALEEARQAIQEYHLEETPWQLALSAGQIAALSGNWDQARPQFRQAIAGLEQESGGLKSPQQRRQWAADKARIYDLAAEAAIQAGDGGAALEFNECNKTRFLQALIERRTQRPKGVEEATWLRYEQAADRRAEIQARRRSTLFKGDPALEEQLRIAEADFAQARAAVQAGSQEELEPQAEFRFPDWQELAQALPSGQTALALAAYPSGLGLVCLSRSAAGEVHVQAQLAPQFTRRDLDALIFGDPEATRQVEAQGRLEGASEEGLGWVIGSLVSPGSPLWLRTIARVCRELGARVWSEVMKLLPAEARDVILLPAAGFNVLPMHAALLPDGRRVDEVFNLTHAPSLGLLAEIRKHSHPSGPAQVGQIANPTEDEGLPYSLVESRVGGRSFPAGQVRRLSGRQASMVQVLGLLKATDLLHFSGHGFFDPGEPFRSGLFCAPADGGGGVLSLSAILNEIGTIRDRFVILSACETGQVQADDELNDYLGLPGGFLVAGADAVLASLWRVADISTCLLLEKFFELWQEEKHPPAEALAGAQQWLRMQVRMVDVVEKIEDWMEAFPEQEEVLAVEHGRWLARDDQQALAFAAEIYWAPFYITGITIYSDF